MIENLIQEKLRKLEKQLKSVKIEGFMINQANKKVFEYIKNNKAKEKSSKVYSITKSIVSLLMGILIERGLIDDVHCPIYKYFPDILKLDDQKKREITIFHLLTMTSGLKVSAFQGTKHWVRFILEQPLVHTPGTTFQYNSGDSHLLSAIINKVTGIPTAAFAEKHLFGPLGIKKYNWVKDPQGIHVGGFGMSMNMEDMMKIGLLLLQNGKYDAQQLISSSWIKESTYTQQNVDFSENGAYGYGYQLWTFVSNNENTIDYFYANGIFGQFIFVVPKLKLVAVVKSHLQNDHQSLPIIYFEDFLDGLGNQNAI